MSTLLKVKTVAKAIKPKKAKVASKPITEWVIPKVVLPKKQPKAPAKPVIQHHIVACAVLLASGKTPSVKPPLVRAPFYMGWAAMPHHTEIEEGDVLTRPYVSKDINCVHPDKASFLLDEGVGVYKDEICDASWCLYRPTAPAKKWVQLKSPTSKVSRGDRLMSPGYTDQGSIRCVDGGMMQGDIGVVVNHLDGYTLQQLHSGEWYGYTLWTKPSSPGPKGGHSLKLEYRLPGNDEYSRPLPLP